MSQENQYIQELGSHSRLKTLKIDLEIMKFHILVVHFWASPGGCHGCWMTLGDPHWELSRPHRSPRSPTTFGLTRGESRRIKQKESKSARILIQSYPGWWFEPLWKILVNWDDEIPNIWENKKCSKPPTSYPISSMFVVANQTTFHSVPGYATFFLLVQKPHSWFIVSKLFTFNKWMFLYSELQLATICQ